MSLDSTIAGRGGESSGDDVQAVGGHAVGGGAASALAHGEGSHAQHAQIVPEDPAVGALR